MTLQHATYDLHLHTCWSYDASQDPEAYFKAAREYGLKAIAITEHHNLDSQEECQELAAGYPDIRFIPAAELTVDSTLGPIDLVCLGFPQDTAHLSRIMETYHAWQQEYGAAVCRGMQALGFDYTDLLRAQLLHTYRPQRVFSVQGQTHVKNEIQRQYFIEQGFISKAEKYGPLLKCIRENSGLPTYPAAEEVLPAIKGTGVVVIIAHPVGYFQGDDSKRMDQLRGELLLDGIECAHRTVPPELVEVYRKYCIDHEMVSTGGSDCHDPEDLERMFGYHAGLPEWLDEVLERLDN